MGLFTKIVILCALGLAAACAAVAAGERRLFARTYRRFVALPWIHKIAVVLSFCVMLARATKEENNNGGDDMNGLPQISQMSRSGLSTEIADLVV